MGGDGWDSPDLFKIGGDTINGSYFSDHFAPTGRRDRAKPNASLQRSPAKYGVPPSGLGALGYEAAEVLVDAIRRAGKDDPTAIRDAIAQTKDFEGVTGKITIDAQRNAQKERGRTQDRRRQGQIRNLDRSVGSSRAQQKSRDSVPSAAHQRPLARSIYALIALGYTMVYGILKLINFAHGEVFMVGAYTGLYAASALGIDAFEGNRAQFSALFSAGRADRRDGRRRRARHVH